jgi:serine/threonine-protein kinase
LQREDEASAPARRRGQVLEEGHVLGGRYTITGFIGAGGMGAVYRARHLRTGRELALKVLLPEFAARPDLMQRFTAEARAAGALNHPGVVEVVDLDHEGDLHYIVMELIEGEELQARMQREHPLPCAFVARVGADIADAISCAHASSPKIVHRDLKPQNVLLARQGRQRDIVKVLDFGIAKLVESETLVHSLTRSGEIYGTPLYMSPEQLRNSKDVDERADIYSIGVILFHALTGVTPFRGESFPDLVISISTEPPPPLRSLRPDAPAGLAAVVEKAMARNRQDRFATALELRNALLPFAEAAGGAAVSSDMFAATQQAPPVTTAKLPPPRARRRSPVRLIVLVAVAGIAAGLGAYVSIHERSRELPTRPAPAVAAPLPAALAPLPAALAPDAAVVTIPPEPPPAAVKTRPAARSHKPKGDDLPALRPR